MGMSERALLNESHSIHMNRGIGTRAADRVLQNREQFSELFCHRDSVDTTK